MRITRHMQQVIIISIILMIAIFALLGLSQEEWLDITGRKADDLRWRLSMSLAYSSIILLAITMSIGTLNLMQGKPNPKHNPTRRAFGVMSAILGLTHLTIGITIHTENWNLLSQFLRYDRHGIANYAGLFQGTLLLILVALSTKWAMSRFRIQLWKNLQRLVYLAFVSIIVHALLYQIIEERSPIIRTIFIGIVAIVILFQFFGVLLRIRSLNVKQNTL